MKKYPSVNCNSAFRGIFASFLLFFSIAATAQKDLPNPPADLQSIPAGSFVIPMDTVYQSIVPAGQAAFNLKAYGLVNKFLQNGIPVKWAIRATKQKDDIDFSATAERFSPSFIAAANMDFIAGPFIVPDTTLPCGLSTTQIISSYANNVAVYKLTSNVTVDVRYTLTHRPKIAVFNNGGNQLIHTKYLDAAGIGNYEVMDAANIESLIDCYTFASEPHADSIQVTTAVVTAVKNFVMNGGNFLAECHAIDAYEDQGFYHTTAGIDVINTNISNHLYPNADLAFSQMHGPLQENETGSIGNWTLSNGSSWLPYFYRSVVSNVGDTVVAVGAHLTAPSSPGGNVYYLGGHDYTRVRGGGAPSPIPNLTTLARVNGLRLYLNAIFVPSGNSNGAWANAGIPSVTIGCTDSVTLGCTPTGPPGSTYSWTPTAGLSCTTCPNPVASPTVTTTYKVEVTNGCIATDTVRVIVPPPPIAQFTNTSVCQGTSTSFTDQSISSSFWQWNFGDPASGVNNTSSLQNPSHSFSTAGSYTVTLISGIQPACADTTIQTIIVYPLPVVSVSSATICAGETTTLTASGANTYSWSTGATIDSVTVSPTSTASYTVTGISALGCVGTGIGTVVVNPLPVVTISSNADLASNSATICKGQAATLTASGADSYSWSTGAIIDSITVNPDTTTSYTVTGSTLGCVGSAIASVTVNPLPVVTVSAATVCAGQTATVTASGASAYFWSTGSSSNSISDNPLATTSYTVTGSTLGCLGTALATITVNPLPVVTTNYTTVCQGQTATLTAGGASSYSWSTGATSDSITDNPASTTSYTVTGNTLGCLGTAVGAINIVFAPVIIVDPDTICVGETATLSAVGAPGYSWSTGATTSQITVSPVSSTTYTVSSTGCPNTATGTITVNPLPVVSVSSATVCFGQAATITASGANTYVWANGSSASSLTVSPSVTTSYAVTGNTAGCYNTSLGTITVTPLQDATFFYTPSTICKTGGSNPSPVITGATGGIFSSAPAGLIIDPSSGLIDVATSNLGTYTITYTTNGVCPSSSNFNVTITNLPSATFSYGVYCQNVADPTPAFPSGSSAGVFSSQAGLVFASPVVIPGTVDLSASTPGTYTVTNTIAASGSCPAAISTNTIVINPVPVTIVNDQTICAGETTSLTASGADSYVWTNGSSTNAITVSPSGNASYTVTGSSSGCSSTAVATVTVNPIPVVAVNSLTICEGNSATLTASGADSYSWSTGASSNPLIVSPAVSTTTTYTVTGNSLGCVQTAIAMVTVNPLPVVTVNSTTICAGETTTLTASGADTYLWTPGGTSGNSITVSPTDTTVYSVTGSSLGCSQTAVGAVTVIPLPIAEFNATPNAATLLEPVITFNDQSSSDVIYWFWDFGDGDTLAPNTASPIHTYPEREAEYLVTLIVHNNRCYDTVSHEVKIGPEYAFFIPNCFTPNGDGFNEGFNGKGIGIIKYHIMIFDRWGNFIWETNSLEEHWNGRANGDPDMDTFYIPRGKGISQQDTYVWKVDLTDVFNREHKYIGIVSIVR